MAPMGKVALVPVATLRAASFFHSVAQSILIYDFMLHGLLNP
jgi:hypothetical protein